MDPKEFEATFGVPSPPVPTSPAGPNAEPQAQSDQALQIGGIAFDPDAIQQVQDMAQGSAQNTQQQPAPTGQEAGSPSPSTMSPEQIEEDRHSGILGNLIKATEPPETLKAFADGAMKGVFETKDFLFGDTAPEDRSAVRTAIESEDQKLTSASLVDGFASGVGQFGIAMMGLGKLGAAAKALPWVARGAEAVGSLAGGSKALEVGKAALAGAIAFDPHAQRLSNLIQESPLANPVSDWLSAKPDDSTALGRVKNAMESIGLDTAIISTFLGGAKIYRHLAVGNTTEASHAVTELEATQRAHVAGSTPNANTVSAAEGTAESAPSPVQPDVPTASDVLMPAELDGYVEAGGATSPQDKVMAEIAKQGTHEVPGAPNVQAALDAENGLPNAEGRMMPTPEDAIEPAPGEISSAQRKFKQTVTFEPGELAGHQGPVGANSGVSPNLLDRLPQTLTDAEMDWANMETHGDWQSVIRADKKISPDLGEFYSHFKTDRDVVDMMDMAAHLKGEELAKQGFRDVLSDAKLQQQIHAIANLSGEDPALLLGTLQQAGEAARTLTAKMVVAGSLTAKFFQDASLMAIRRAVGDYTEFGGKQELEAQIAKRFSLATTMLNITNQIRAQGGRTVRANRGKAFDPSLFEGLTGERFYTLLAQAQGSPEKLRILAEPGLGRKIMDTVNYLRVSSLVSGPVTQFRNIMAGGYMIGVRPLERILGAVPSAAIGSDASRAMIKENIRQYAYMGTALMDGFGSAVKAFTQNDGILKPHGSEAFANQGRFVVPGTQGFGPGFYRTWDSVPNIIYNALSTALAPVGVAPRVLGSTDELVKQIVYRSKLLARAHVEGVEQATQAGLKGKPAATFLKSYVDSKMAQAFDSEGRGLDPEALREANIATFQQELMPGTFGAIIQNGVAKDKTQLTRLILPFVKTPTNVLRYGWKMTPGLNLLQGEYKQMLSGSLGLEAKNQAIGQMTMGALFMGAAAYLGSQGMITGGGPTDPRLKAQLLATGWQPYSIVTVNADGTKTYTPFSKYDPIALPFGIIADIQDAYHLTDNNPNNQDIQKAVGALGISLAKQFTSRTYLLSLNQALEALSDPDRAGFAFAGGLAQSMVPFSAATRQMSTDPYMRDARTMADKMMQAIPGLSQSLPPRYNWLGQPMLNRQGLWSDDNGSLVDNEVQRLAIEGGSVISPPSYKLNDNADLRTITTVKGENAYELYQRLAGKPGPNAKSLRDAVAGRMQSKAYLDAPDGDAKTRGTKLWLLSGIVDRYRDAAKARLKTDKNVRDALMATQRQAVEQFREIRQKRQADTTGGKAPSAADLANIQRAFGAGLPPDGE